MNKLEGLAADIARSKDATEIRMWLAELILAIEAAQKNYDEKVMARIEAEQDAGLAWRRLCALEERLQREHGLRRVSKENPS